MNLSSRILFVATFVLVIWVASMIRILKNPKLNDTTRFMWVFIVTMMPAFGTLLYLLHGSNPMKSASVSEIVEEEAKKRMIGIHEKTEWENR